MRAATQTAAQRRADNALIRRALKVLEDRLDYNKPILASPTTVRDFLRLRMAQLEHEVFLVLWLDAQHRLIEVHEASKGTLTQASVFPREIVKAGLAANAGACILAHNHPSGSLTQSSEDEKLTQVLKEALALVDIRVLDHFIVAGAQRPLSFAERGLL